MYQFIARSKLLEGKTFCSRSCHNLFSNFFQTWQREALGAVPSYNCRNNHVPAQAWLFHGLRDWFRTPPKFQQFHTDLHLGKRASAGHKTRTGMSYTNYRFPMRHRCKCMKTTHVGRGNEILILERCGLHDGSSHEQVSRVWEIYFTDRGGTCSAKSFRCCNSQEHAMTLQFKQDHWSGA